MVCAKGFKLGTTRPVEHNRRPLVGGAACVAALVPPPGCRISQSSQSERANEREHVRERERRRGCMCCICVSAAVHTPDWRGGEVVARVLTRAPGVDRGVVTLIRAQFAVSVSAVRIARREHENEAGVMWF